MMQTSASVAPLRAGLSGSSPSASRSQRDRCGSGPPPVLIDVLAKRALVVLGLEGLDVEPFDGRVGVKQLPPHRLAQHPVTLQVTERLVQTLRQPVGAQLAPLLLA